jgi:hypothetical protein
VDFEIADWVVGSGRRCAVFDDGSGEDLLDVAWLGVDLLDVSGLAVDRGVGVFVAVEVGLAIAGEGVDPCTALAAVGFVVWGVELDVAACVVAVVKAYGGSHRPSTALTQFDQPGSIV